MRKMGLLVVISQPVQFNNQRHLSRNASSSLGYDRSVIILEEQRTVYIPVSQHYRGKHSIRPFCCPFTLLPRRIRVEQALVTFFASKRLKRTLARMATKDERWTLGRQKQEPYLRTNNNNSSKQQQKQQGRMGWWTIQLNSDDKTECDTDQLKQQGCLVVAGLFMEGKGSR